LWSYLIWKTEVFPVLFGPPYITIIPPRRWIIFAKYCYLSSRRGRVKVAAASRKVESLKALSCCSQFRLSFAERALKAFSAFGNLNGVAFLPAFGTRSADSNDSWHSVNSYFAADSSNLNSTPERREVRGRTGAGQVVPLAQQCV